MTNTDAHTVKYNCCKKMEKAGACKSNKKAAPDNCSSQACGMLLTCGICGFLPQQPITLQPAKFTTAGLQLAEYRVAVATGYFPPDWKPPKV